MRMKYLGKNGPQLSALGLGCGRMSMKKPRADDESIGTIKAVLDAGINFLDTGDFYGMGHNESLVSRAIKGQRNQAFLSVKFGIMMSPSGAFLGIEGRPNSVKNFASYSLQRLGVDVIDLYQPGRPDPSVPYEETIGAIADLIKEGKVRYLGVSEAGAANLRRAHSVHPVTALEIEYSLACRFIERENSADSEGVGRRNRPLSRTRRWASERGGYGRASWRRYTPRSATAAGREPQAQRRNRLVPEGDGRRQGAFAGATGDRLASHPWRRHHPASRHESTLAVARESRDSRHQLQRGRTGSARPSLRAWRDPWRALSSLCAEIRCTMRNGAV